MSTDDDIPAEPLCRIVCAAILHRESGLVIAGVRHYDPIMREVIRTMIGDDPQDRSLYGCEQGFLTNTMNRHLKTYEYVTREQAWKIAEAAGQIRPRKGQQPGCLYSEDLY